MISVASDVGPSSNEKRILSIFDSQIKPGKSFLIKTGGVYRCFNSSKPNQFILNIFLI